jgi:hypothetical protein
MHDSKLALTDFSNYRVLRKEFVSNVVVQLYLFVDKAIAERVRRRNYSVELLVLTHICARIG